MEKVFNRKSQKRVRQYLRNNATNAEKLLWESLKGKQLDGHKFRRQHGIERYIVDFYCAEKKLAIEIDGATHSTTSEKEHDRVKAEHIQAHGVHLIRFTNDDVYDNIDAVLEGILSALKRDAQKQEQG